MLPCSDVKAIDAEDKQDLAAFPFDEEAEFKGLGDALPVGEKGFTTLERRCTPPPSCMPDLPRDASAKCCSCRGGKSGVCQLRWCAEST